MHSFCFSASDELESDKSLCLCICLCVTKILGQPGDFRNGQILHTCSLVNIQGCFFSFVKKGPKMSFLQLLQLSHRSHSTIPGKRALFFLSFQILFALAMLPFVYMMSFVFTSSLIAYSVVALILLVLSLVSLINNYKSSFFSAQRSEYHILWEIITLFLNILFSRCTLFSIGIT